MGISSYETFYKTKLIDPSRLKEAVLKIRKEGKTIVTLNGSFDLLHAGHLEILFQAAACADVFIVALNSDSSIKQYKSPTRPFVSLEDRMKMMAAIACVDYVTYFEETTPLAILQVIKPDVHVNGSEYGKDCIEAPTVKAGGGRVHIVELVPGLSTSALVAKIKAEKGAPCA